MISSAKNAHMKFHVKLACPQRSCHTYMETLPLREERRASNSLMAATQMGHSYSCDSLVFNTVSGLGHAVQTNLF